MDGPKLYVAVPLPEALQARLVELQAALASPLWDLKPSDPADFHLTLHYLGPTPERVIDDLKRELGALAHARRPFDLECRGLGCFPDDTDPRVLWAGVEDAHGRLQELFEASRRVLNSYRLFKLNDSYAPHLTLARVRRLSAAWKTEPWRALVKDSGRLGRLPVEELRLMESPQHRSLAALRLQA